MEGIKHRTVEVNGISMHVAETGSEEGAASLAAEKGAVLFLHGFPELWYSWRRQMVGLAAHGYRCVAPDLRGFGGTSAPPSSSVYTVFHIVGDLVALLDALSLSRVYVVGHDWGAFVAWSLCRFRPDRVKALVNLSVAERPWNPAVKPLQFFRRIYGDDYYSCRFQEPGVAEEEFSGLDLKYFFKKVLTTRAIGRGFLAKKDWNPAGEHITLPSWLSEEDIDYYASTFQRTGFTGGMNYYRNLDLNLELSAPWAGAKIKVPTKFIVGDHDVCYHYPGIQDYIHKGGFQNEVPLLEEVVVLEGAAHFFQQERAQEVTNHVHPWFHPQALRCCCMPRFIIT